MFLDLLTKIMCCKNLLGLVQAESYMSNFVVQLLCTQNLAIKKQICILKVSSDNHWSCLILNTLDNYVGLLQGPTNVSTTTITFSIKFMVVLFIPAITPLLSPRRWYHMFRYSLVINVKVMFIACIYFYSWYNN